MKRFLICVSALLLLVSVVGCNQAPATEEVKRIDGEKSVNATENDTRTEEKVEKTEEKKDFQFPIQTDKGEIKLAIRMPLDEVIGLIGEPSDSFEAPSCASDIKDTVYDYDHYEIWFSSYPDGDILTSITFKDDIPATEEGLSIGSSKEKMEELYGTDYEVMGKEFIYRAGGMSLHFQITNNQVSYVSYNIDLD